MKKTDFFVGGEFPARVGVYQTDHGYQHWNGVFWGGWAGDVLTAKKYHKFRSSAQRPSWRGLTTKDGK